MNRQHLIDAGVAIALTIAIVVSIRFAWEPRATAAPDAAAYGVGIVIGALTLFRRRAPLFVLFASAAALQIYYFSDYRGSGPRCRYPSHSPPRSRPGIAARR